jgi:hypothetical protein
MPDVGEITIDVTLTDVINTFTVLNVATPIIIPSEYDIGIAGVDQPNQPKKFPRYAWVKNLGKDAQVMLNSDVDPETDSNYLTIAGGDAVRIPIRRGRNKFYLKGPSTFAVILSDDGTSPFKSAQKASSGSGSLITGGIVFDGRILPIYAVGEATTINPDDLEVIG